MACPVALPPDLARAVADGSRSHPATPASREELVRWSKALRHDRNRPKHFMPVGFTERRNDDARKPPLRPPAGGWAAVIHAHQFRPASQCDRWLLIEDDLGKTGLGFTARLVQAALLIAMREGRVLLEVPPGTLPVGVPRSDAPPPAMPSPPPPGAPPRRGRWCDEPPYTFQCVYEAWTNCSLRAEELATVEMGPVRMATGRPGKPNASWARWPSRRTAVVGLRLSRLHKWMPGWQGIGGVAAGAAQHFLFSPRPWVAEIGECTMRRDGLQPGRFITTHIRESPEKAKEMARVGQRPPPREGFFALSAFVAHRLGLRHVFLQTASPAVVPDFEAFARAPGGLAPLALSVTNNARIPNDSWGEHAGASARGARTVATAVAAVNAYVAARALVALSPRDSAWTGYLKGQLGGSTEITYACCKRAKGKACPRSVGTIRLFAAGRPPHGEVNLSLVEGRTDDALAAAAGATSMACGGHEVGYGSVKWEVPQP